jgi:LPS-assembly lipoprotein
MSRYLSHGILGFMLIVLAGCGFHLRGAADLPSHLKSMYVQGVDTQRDFGLALKRALKSNDVMVLDAYQTGAAVLTIVDNSFERQVLSVGSDAKVSEYELLGRVTFKVSDDKGNLMLSEQTIEAQRDYQFDQNQVLASDNQERALREQLNQQLAQSILRRLSALK